MNTSEILEKLVIVREGLPINQRKQFQQIINRVATDEFYIQKLIAWYENDNDKDYFFEGEMMKLIQSRNGKGGDDGVYNKS